MDKCSSFFLCPKNFILNKKNSKSDFFVIVKYLSIKQFKNNEQKRIIS